MQRLPTKCIRFTPYILFRKPVASVRRVKLLTAYLRDIADIHRNPWPFCLDASYEIVHHLGDMMMKDPVDTQGKHDYVFNFNCVLGIMQKQSGEQQDRK